MPRGSFDPACPFATSVTFDGWLHAIPCRSRTDGLSWRRPRGVLEAYLVGAAFVVIATLIRLAVDQYVIGSQFATYFIAVVGATLCGGLCVGLFSMILSILPAWYFFLEPHYAGLSAGEVYSLLAFVLVASPIIYITALLQNAGAFLNESRMRAAVAEERARAADELRRWKDIFDGIAVGIYVVEPVHNAIVMANPAFLALHGMSEDECRGTSIYDLYPSSYTDRVTALIRRCDEAGSVNGEAIHRRKDGSTFPVRLHGSCVRTQTGAISYRVCSATDISDERELQNRWTEVFENAEFGISIVDPATNLIRLCNRAYASAHGMSAEEIYGMSALDCYPINERARVGGLLAASDDNGHVDFETDRIRKDGSVFPARVHVTTVKEPARGLRYRISTVYDMTHERDLQAQLSQSQRLEAIGQLCAGVAHDFNNLLQGIISFLELVEDDAVPAETQEKVGTAIRLAEQGGSLAQRLLSFGRKQLLLPEDIDLHDFLEDFSRLLSRTLDPRIRVELMIAPDLTTLFADPSHLRHALLNLAINARDAMPAGGYLVLEARYGDSSREGVVFRITDTGCGIAPDNLNRVCEPFFSTKGLNGTGLGLSMVHGFAKQSGGDFSISSELGVGTRVDLTLPVRPDRESAAAA